MKQDASKKLDPKRKHESVMENYNNQPVTTAARKLRLSKLQELLKPENDTYEPL